MSYEIREIAEEIAHTTQEVPVLGSDNKPKLDGAGKVVTTSTPVTIRSHSVLYVVKDGDHSRPARAKLTVSDSDTVSAVRAKADAAVKAALGL
jgi:hypothetical protein